MLGGSRLSAPYRCALSFRCSAQSLLVLGAGVLAGAAAGVEEPADPEELESLDVDEAGVDDDEELSDEPAFDEALEPPRLSVL